MKLYSELSVGERIALTFVIVLAILLALALFGYLTGGWDDAAAQPPLSSSKYDQDIIELDRVALNEAYRERVRHLFGVWMADPRDQPNRALTGVANARRAFIGALTEIEKRERK
jgi:hypothetical protein